MMSLLKLMDSSPHTSPTDDQLVERYRRGETEALGEFYNRHSRPLYLYACSLSGDPSRAEDLLQQAFLRVLKRDRSEIDLPLK